MAKTRRCGAVHPTHPQVLCEERGEHDRHFNSFFMRAWDVVPVHSVCDKRHNLSDPCPEVEGNFTIVDALAEPCPYCGAQSGEPCNYDCLSSEENTDAA